MTAHFHSIFSSLVSCALLTTISGGCGGSPPVGASAEGDSLRAVIAALQAEVDELRHGAPRLLAEVQTAFEARRYGEVQRLAVELAQRHPQSAEAETAKGLAARAEAAVRREREATERRAVELKRAEAARLARALQGLWKKRDDVQNMTIYRDASSPRFVNSRSNLCLSLVVPDNGTPALALHIYYVSDDWLFIERYVVKAGDRTWEIPVEYGEVERDNQGGEIFEWYTTPAENHMDMIRAIVNAPTVTLRYNGRQYKRDRTITDIEKRALQHMLDAKVALTAGRG